MNFRNNRVLDYSSRIDTNSCPLIILGNNGSGKTIKITEKYKHETAEKKTLVLSTYPVASFVFAKAFHRKKYLDQLQTAEILDNEINHINLVTAKLYKTIKYKVLDINEFLSDNFGEKLNYKNLFGELFDKDSLEIIYGSNYFYFDVELVNGEKYSTLEMGVGEQYLISLFLLLFKRKDQKLFIDEPFNYISTKALENITKLMIFSSSVNKNEIVMTTNALEIIDYLKDFRCPFKIVLSTNYREQNIELSLEEFYNFFSERYSLYNKSHNVIFVEDELIKSFINFTWPSLNVFQVGGSGKMKSLLKSILDIGKPCFEEINSKFIFVFDGDQAESIIRELPENEYTHLLPFKDIEKFICSDLSHSSSGFLSGFCGLEPYKIHQVKEIVESCESHEAYKRIKKVLGINDYDCFSYINNVFHEELKQIKELIERV
ncbi:MAG: hypothetical protein CVU96_00345 [Firmicutes bacterium HGW-Firmicutes-20]|jgi:hypothetical protein|nr:MAG: hypothetical protein CVU96_00345 [Firmicutes bacterium HGW-Firmicutes-20]PKM70239.1 MAG: hypothetical protein CVU94_00055 [Firmicutes bacterium HGW-Firmicutes-19]